MCVDWHCHESGDGCQCVKNMFSSGHALKGVISHFSSASDTNQDMTVMVEHLFQCAEAILYCEREESEHTHCIHCRMINIDFTTSRVQF